MSYPILDTIHSAHDVKMLAPEQLPALADELRKYLIEAVSAQGGHLASNLGVVELSIALHRVFKTPHDHIIFDVGHQSYVHKLLTGRREAFSTLRQPGGLSGFPCRSESEHDCFGTGHASTSISAALGFAEADRICGSNAYSVAVVGDGAFTGGMIHEALNNCSRHLRLIIILNENEMSISKNNGRFARNLARLRTSEPYFRTKRATRRFITRLPIIGQPLFRLIRREKQAVKNMLYGSNYFEDLGLYYLGPADGHDIAALESVLREAKDAEQSVVIHIKTQKGKGYAPAERSPDAYHAVAPADGRAAGTNFSSVFGETLCTLARHDPHICAITAAMSSGTGLEPFRRACSARFFDVGIAEEHAVTFAAGLAAAGMRPVAAIYSSFLQRAYDSILHDVALQKLPVVLCVDRAGLNAADGATHHGIFDVAFLGGVPGITIYTPATYAGLRSSLAAALKAETPTAIRYPNASASAAVLRAFYPSDDAGELRGVRANYLPDEAPSLTAVIVVHGRMADTALEAAETLYTSGVRCGVLLLEQLAPWHTTAQRIAALLPHTPGTILFLEEEIRAGGMGMTLRDAMADMPVMANKRVKICAVDNCFPRAEAGKTIWESAGVSAADAVAAILEP